MTEHYEYLNKGLAYGIREAIRDDQEEIAKKLFAMYICNCFINKYNLKGDK